MVGLKTTRYQVGQRFESAFLQRIRFRIGINLGDVIVEEHDISATASAILSRSIRRPASRMLLDYSDHVPSFGTPDSYRRGPKLVRR
jgi:hypothetical protein